MFSGSDFKQLFLPCKQHPFKEEQEIINTISVKVQ